MNDQEEQVVQKLQNATNILVTVHSSPTVDQLAAAIALTLLLNKMDKHATAVFSGAIPPAIKFLRPEETIEKNTDSLRDFIVALDKGKADKLRYKVEDEVVKIFITPYKSSINEKDLIFSQGDFNVDVVVALGVHQQQDLDEAITAHGRILHDAAVITINNSPAGELGSINWQDESASGLSEMVAGVAAELGENLLDSQIATALLTGVVAETGHFSNERTTPHTMTISATLLGAGADQQLVANQLDMPGSPNGATVPVFANTAKPTAGMPKIETPKGDKQIEPLPEQEPKDTGPTFAAMATEPAATPHVEPDKAEPSLEKLLQDADAEVNQPLAPTLPAPVALPTNIASPLPVDVPDLNDTIAGTPLEPATVTATPADGTDSDSGKTLTEIEAEVQSPHVEQAVDQPENKAVSSADDGEVDTARKAVEDALKASGDEVPMLEPLEALNAQSVDLDLNHGAAATAPQIPLTPPADSTQPAAGAAAPVVTPNAAPDLPPYEPTPLPGNGQGLPPLSPLPNEPPAIVPLAGPGVMSTPAELPFGATGASSPLGAPTFGPPPAVPATLPMDSAGISATVPAAPIPLPPNPAINEPAPLTMSPADQPFTMPLPPSGMGSVQVPPPQIISPTSTTAPPQGPPPPPMPPPLTPPGMP